MELILIIISIALPMMKRKKGGLHLAVAEDVTLDGEESLYILL